ncbi:UbiA prenyltransferase family [Xylaria nigripes]|nr:UbiA prenyltransferase family [Xylaria nigripes]
MSETTLRQRLLLTRTSPMHLSSNTRSQFSTILNYLYTIHLTCADDVGYVVLSGLVFAAINSSIASQYSLGPALSSTEILAAVPRIVLWSWSNLFLFCLNNQKQENSIAEDKVNKYWRPIPSGRMTAAQATRTTYIMHPVCFLICAVMGGFIPYIILTLSELWYHELNGASNGILKNIQNGIGLMCFLVGPLEVATQHSVISGNWQLKGWLAFITAVIATTSHTQDFRDMEGDAAVGRRTIPLVYGDTASRIFIAVAAAIWTPAACYLWGRQGISAYISAALLVGNLFLNRSKEGDSLSWKLWWSVWVASLALIPYGPGTASNILTLY